MRVGQDAALIFLHIPKAAGTTLRKIIERQYRRFTLFSAYDDSRRSGNRQLLASLPRAKSATIGLLEGHIEYGWHELLPKKALYLTMLREPTERVVSNYYFILKHPGHRLHELANKYNIDEFVKARVDHDSLNGQTQWLSGKLSSPEHEITIDDTVLQLAKQNVLDKIECVGVSEKFDQSIVSFQKKLRWRWIYYTRQNVTKSRPAVDALSDRTLRTIREANQLDLDLYNLALSKFEESVGAMGDAFLREVAHFELANRTYGRFASLLLDSDEKSLMRLRTKSGMVNLLHRLKSAERPS
jgi:Galactose-3-O-sulfotransferase